MKLVLAEPGILRDSITVISDLVNEGRFKITKDGLEMIAMDPANVAMVIFKLLSSCFAEFDMKKDQELALNLASLKQILRRSGPSDTLTLELTAENKLQVQLKGKSTRTFSLPLIDLTEREQKVPNLTFPVNIAMPSSALNDAIADVDIVAESVAFAAQPDLFIVAAEGDLSKVNIEIRSDNDTTIASSTQEKVKSKYSVEYLKKMIAGSKLADNVEVHFSQDYPLRLDYKAVDKLLMSFILAPRVEND